MKDYVRGKKIGQGSFGKVFLVTRLSDNFECVEKEIGLDGISDKDRAEIKKEIEVQEERISRWNESHCFGIANEKK